MARLLLAAALLALFHVTMSVTVVDFFKDADVKSNLTKIQWAHAVNSKAKLDETLKSNKTIHMIEADVNLGRLPGAANTTELIPVMNHDGGKDVVSDLSLQEFLNTVIKNKTKGVKLDFKSIEAVQKGLEVLKLTKNNTDIPIWLNADILVGPGKPDSIPVNSKQFVEAVKPFNNTLLSIGWTTKLAPLSPNQNFTSDNYTKAQIDEMIKVLKDNKLNQSVTYPVRAALAANDVDGLNYLLTNTSANNPTLTIWTHETDKINITGLNKLIKTIGLGKIYLDLPQDIRNQLDLNGAFTVKSSLAVLMTSLLAAVFAVKLL